jgi:hypothetical protein
LADSTFDVFLSYNGKDRSAVRKLYQALMRRGLRPWLDEKELPPGQPWQKKIEQILETVRAAAVLFGPAGIGPWEEPEMWGALSEFVKRQLPVIPVLLPGAPQEAELPLFLKQFTWVDLRDGLNKAGLDRLVWGITQEKPDLRPYLEALVDRTDHINVSGIASATVQGALRHPIERLYTPLRSRALELTAGLRPGHGLEGEIRLADLLPRFARLLVEGQPGAGKTTFLRFTACMLARDALGLPCPKGASWSRRYLGLTGDRRPVPVLLRIADLVPLLTADASALRADDRGRLLDLLAAMSTANAYPLDRRAWQELLEGERALLLLDGLDEVADERLRERVFDVFRDASRRWRCRMVVSSRPIQTAALRDMGFHVATVEPFGDAEIRGFLDHWVAALYAAANPEALKGEGQRYRQVLLAAICGSPRVRRLATNPVMLTCLCVVHWNEGQLPEGRSRVYRAVVRWLIAARTALRQQEGFTDYFALRAFARLALAMMASEEGKRSVLDLEDAAVAIAAVVEREFPQLVPEDRRHAARRWLRFECLGSGVVEEVSGNRLRFWHLTFQEFLAALQLAWLGDGDTAGQDWWPLAEKHLDGAPWREVIDLLPGCLLDEGGEGRVDKLLDRVLALSGQNPTLAAEARVAGIAGRLLQTLTAYQYRPRPDITAAYDSALDRSLAIFTRPGAAQVPVAVRIEVAEALGRGGDPRLGEGKDNFLEVPGLGGLRLGKYPVTVDEYLRFVESRGYEEPQHWGDDGWRVKLERGWEEPDEWEGQLEAPNRPVVGVSWYEAAAYCRWLSEQRGEPVRLPTEAEWEKAATPERGEYPWGTDEPDAERANFDQNVGRPTPVGIYPAGDGPHGHSDLAGNVWEWCADRYEFHGEDARGLRGGGWFYPAVSLRAACRDWYPARYRFDDIGFRVAAVPASL